MYVCSAIVFCWLTCHYIQTESRIVLGIYKPGTSQLKHAIQHTMQSRFYFTPIFQLMSTPEIGVNITYNISIPDSVTSKKCLLKCMAQLQLIKVSHMLIQKYGFRLWFISGNIMRMRAHFVKLFSFCLASLVLGTMSTLRKDFVILQLYWWLFSSTKHRNWNMV